MRIESGDRNAPKTSKAVLEGWKQNLGTGEQAVIVEWSKLTYL